MENVVHFKAGVYLSRLEFLFMEGCILAENME